MRKIYSLLAVLFFSLGIISAQQPDNRTATTIIADVLAQVPAQSEEQYSRQQKELLSTGENGILQLVKMLNASNASDAKIKYALNGLSGYVSAEGQEANRMTVVNAYLTSLDDIRDADTKAFIISLFEIAGKDEAVVKLASYLDDPYPDISSPAAKALVAINTPASRQALLSALKTASKTQSKNNVILAIAKLQMPEAEDDLKALLNGNADLRESALYALGRCGSAASLSILSSAAEKAGYASDKAGTVDSYLALIQRILAQGETKTAVKAATDLWKKAEKAGCLQTREAALQILFAAEPDNASKLLKDALKDKNRDYRNAALNYAFDYAGQALYKELSGYLKKADPELKKDILNGFAQVYDNPNKKEFIDASFTPVFAELLADKDPEVRQAAIVLLTKTGGETAIAALAKLLNASDEQSILSAKNALTVTRGEIAPAIVPLLATAGDVGKIAILQLLAGRKADKYGNVVFEQLQASSPAVRTAAYAALQDIVSEKDLAVLYNLLEQSEVENITPVQQAIVAALKPLSKEKQFEIISAQINKTDKKKQARYYSVLAASGNGKALIFIVDRFKTGSTNDRDAAFQALLRWSSIEVVDELLAICRDTGAAPYFDKALNRYIRLISNPGLKGENRRIFLTNALEIAQSNAQKKEILIELGQTGSFLGMLLAGKYLDESALQQEAAGAVMNIALNNKDFTGKKVRELLEKVSKVLDNPDAGYQREAIRKHLNEMPDEEGFVSIFNGKDLTGWKGSVENPTVRAKMKPVELDKAQVKADEQMRKDWKVENGLLVFDGTGYDNLCTEKQYGDFEMYVDWKLESSRNADAGIYLRGTPQVQIWNTARTDVGAQVGSGGLYNNKNNPSEPLQLADNKLEEWNTFYIKMIGDRVTVVLNGEMVVDNVILENYWDRSQPVFPVEQIELQAHGSKVYYRNVYVKELERPEPFELSDQEKKEGFRILFDGTNMHQWTGNTVDYILEDGCISMHPSKNHGGNLYTKEEFGNFVFRFEFQLTPDANNGLGIRTPMEGDAAYVGMELQILDNEAPVYKNLAPYQYHGSVYGIIPSKRGFLKPNGEWNYQEVVADGDHIKVTLNGTVILDGNIREAVKNGTPDKQDHPGLFNKKGYLGFLGHGSPLKFRNIRIRTINNK
jgi:HEAT repeat protein